MSDISSNRDIFSIANIVEQHKEKELYDLFVEFAAKHPFRPAPNTTWRNYVSFALRAKLENLLGHLTASLSHDIKAVEVLLDIAVNATETLTRLAKADPQRIKHITSRHLLWPFLKSGKRGLSDVESEINSLIKKLNLSASLPFHVKTLERIKKQKVGRITAVKLLCEIESYRTGDKWDLFLRSRKFKNWQKEAIKLKPFSAKTWKAWSNTAFKALMDKHYSHPEKDPDLEKLGKSGAKHYESERTVGLKAFEKTRACNVRQRIKYELEEVIRTLADRPRKTRKNQL